MQTRETAMFHALRVIASFALLGAVLAGAVFAWFHWSVDPRVIGAIVGGVFGLAIVIRHMSHQAADPIYARL